MNRAAQLVPVGERGVAITRLGVGTATLGNGFGEVDDPDARRLLEAARELGIRYLDTAPLYGNGLSERRLGAMMPVNGDFVLSTKVGRVLDLSEPTGWRFDFSREGIRRSIESSLVRLGRDRVDIAFVHDPVGHEREVYKQAWPALLELRDEGIVCAIGAGMNESAMLLRFVQRLDPDIVLLAGRYTLLDSTAADSLLPECLVRQVPVVLGGVFNSGVLVDPREGAWFDYLPATPETVRRARSIRDVAERHGVTLPHVALQFAAAHPAVISVLVGVGSDRELIANVEALNTSLPEALWSDLNSLGLLPLQQFVLDPPR